MSRKLPGSAAVRLTICLVSVAAVVAVVAAAQSRHASLVLSHYLRGRAGQCTLPESFEGEAISRLQSSYTEEVTKTSRVIRTDGPYALWSTPMGQYWMASASGGALAYDLAEQKRKIYGDGIRPGAIVLDCGANVGVFARTALSAGAAKVIAIEPAPENLECLRRNLAQEISAGKVIVYPKGVWDKDDILKLAVDPKNSAADSFVRTDAGTTSIEVPLTTIDKLVAELQLPRVDFIKMDIEGSELRALQGAAATIARHHPRMAISIYHLKRDDAAVPALVSRIDSRYSVRRGCLCTSENIQPEVAFF